MRIAVIADVHGNRWALEAVLEDIEKRRCDFIINAGDCVFGPLDPGGSASILMNLETVTVRGNQDRVLACDPDRVEPGSTLQFVLGELTPDQVTWFSFLPKTASKAGVFVFHGTPASDEAYFLEEISGGQPVLRENRLIAGDLPDADCEVAICGHTHIQRAVQITSGPLCVNPGSVGLPAYTDDLPTPHAMESGSPHARYSLLVKTETGWNAELMVLPYDWITAARVAETNGRPDWARWIKTGLG